MGLSASAHAFEEQETKKVEKEEETERIEVTGSRIKRVDMESVSPVVVVDIEEMRDKGFSTAYDALKDLTQASGTVQGAEFGAQGGFTPNAQTVSLRGLGTNQVLVLVNGRRMADYPRPYNGRSNFVNLSTIPFAAIKRIEIVTGGASAVYGSDAVAGVMNIITKTDVNDTTVNYLHSTTTEGEGDQNRLQIVTGTTGDDYTLTAALEYHKINPIFASDRDWLDSVDDGPAGRDYLDRAILKFDPFAGTYRDPGEQACIDSQSGFGYAFREGRGYYCGGDFTGQRTIRNERENMSAYINGTYQLTDSTELFLDVLWADQKALVRGGNHWVGEYVLEAAPNGGNFGDLDYVLKQRQFNQHEMGWRDSDYDESSILVNIGAKGTMFEDYDWEFVASRSENTSDSARDWLKEEAVFPIFFGTGTYGFGLPDGEGEVGLYDPITDDIKNRLVGTQIITSSSYSNNLSFVVSGSAFELEAGDAYFAVVAEWNKQGYELTPDERTLNRDGQGWYNLTGTGGGGDRERYALGLELDVPLMENLDLKLAGRYDKYDDDTTEIGGRFTPSVGLTYNPTEDILVRANWGRSFRAPDMHRVFAGPSGFFTSAYDWVKCEIDYDGANGPFQPNEDFCDSSSVQGFSQGSKVLEEEKGQTYGLGMVWDVTEEFNFSVDWYRIELEQIVVSQSVQGLLDDAYDCKFGLEGRDPNGGFCAQINSQIARTGSDHPDPGSIQDINTGSINAAAHEIEGIDATLRYNIETEHGEFAAVLGWSHVLEMVYKATDEDTDENDRDKAWNDDARSIMNASLSWTMDDTSIVLSGRRIGSIPASQQPVEYSDPESPTYNKVDRLHPYILFNLTGSYQFSEDLSLTLQVVNLFNNKPPYDETETSWPFYNAFQYGGGSVGREVGMEVRYTF